MAVTLDCPDDEAEIYHARAGDLSLARPLLTGDVLEGVELPGLEHDTAMIVAHPCSMRRGVTLEPKLTCAPVIDYKHVPPGAWGSGFVRVFPLSDFGDGDHRAALLNQLVSVDSTSCDIEKRVACLEHNGIYLLQQRLIHCLARCKVELSEIRHSMEHVLVEAELQEDWVEELATDLDDPDSRASAVEEFDRYLIENGLRSQLQDPNKRSSVNSYVTREIYARVGV